MVCGTGWDDDNECREARGAGGGGDRRGGTMDGVLGFGGGWVGVVVVEARLAQG